MPNYLEYRKSISRELSSIKNRVRNFIDNKHWGEDGRYKEDILIETLKPMLPSTVSIGTGFVVGDNNIVSTQIDIIIYKNIYPVLFKNGDFVVVSEESVVGIIEVKSTLRSNELNKVLKKAHNNGKIIGVNKFNGIFAYETDIGLNYNNLDIRTEEKFKKYSRYINNIAFDKDYFMKFWPAELPTENERIEHISIYRIEDLAMGYFISNLIEDSINSIGLIIEKSSDYYERLYPIEGSKERYRIYDIKL